MRVTDANVLVASAPVVSRGRVMGVVSADTLVETFEKLLLPSFRAAGATLVNDLGRTVTSSDQHQATRPIIDFTECREVITCDRLPFSVVRL